MRIRKCFPVFTALCLASVLSLGVSVQATPEETQSVSAVAWDKEIDGDITDGDYLTKNLGLDKVTRQSVLRTISENWTKGLKYSEAVYTGNIYNAAKSVNYGDRQYIGNEKTDYGYNCSGFVASVLYYANGNSTEDAYSKMEQIYLPFKHGRILQNQKSFADGSGWYYYFKGEQKTSAGLSHVTKTNLYHLGQTTDADSIQAKLEAAEQAGKLKPGYVLYFWPTGKTDCHVGIYAGKNSDGEHLMYHAIGGSGREHNGVYIDRDITLSRAINHPSDLYVIPLPEEEEPPEYAVGWLRFYGYWYYYSEAGVRQTGWQKVGDYWYFLQGDGRMQTGWKWSGGKWYYLIPGTGRMATGWRKVSGKWYLFDGNGAMLTGWQKIGGTWYFLKNSGDMAQEEYCKGYWLRAGGAWDGQARASWSYEDGYWYYGNAGWHAKNVSLRIDGKVYAFDVDGRWIEPEEV